MSNFDIDIRRYKNDVKEILDKLLLRKVLKGDDQSMGYFSVAKIFRFESWDDCFAYEFSVRVGSAKKVSRVNLSLKPRDNECPELDDRNDRTSQWTDWAGVIYSSKTEQHKRVCEVKPSDGQIYILYLVFVVIIIYHS